MAEFARASDAVAAGFAFQIENSEANARLEELEQEESDLRDEARRMNIPAGWLRAPRNSGGGG